MNDSLQQQLEMLNRLCKECNHIYGRLAAKLGMTESAFWVLYAITHSEEPLTQNDLCSSFFFPVQTIHSAINGLRSKGLLELQVIHGTRNRKAILLTEAGRAFAADTISRADKMEKNALLMFTEEDRALYLSLYQRHIAYLKGEAERLLDDASE